MSGFLTAEEVAKLKAMPQRQRYAYAFGRLTGAIDARRDLDQLQVLSAELQSVIWPEEP